MTLASEQYFIAIDDQGTYSQVTRCFENNNLKK